MLTGEGGVCIIASLCANLRGRPPSFEGFPFSLIPPRFASPQRSPQGECKFTITDEGHSEWVSCVRFSPSPTAPVIVSCGWDKKVKVRYGRSRWSGHGVRDNPRRHRALWIDRTTPSFVP